MNYSVHLTSQEIKAWGDADLAKVVKNLFDRGVTEVTIKRGV